MARPHNLPLNHIGLAVDSIDKAADWYTTHFGFRRLRSDAAIDAAQEPDNPMFRMYGDSLRRVRICWLVAGNGVGFELFEFVDPPVKPAEELRREFSLQEQYQRGGVFHYCVTAPDPVAVAKQACEDGAVQIGEAWEMGPEKGVYLRDPWGMVVEVLSCSYESLLANTA